MHKNSLKAYSENAPHFKGRASMIYNKLIERGAMTDRQLMTELGFTERNEISPRVTELKEGYWVRELGDIDELIKGRKVRVRLVAARTKEDRLAYIRSLEANHQLDLFKAA